LKRNGCNVKQRTEKIKLKSNKRITKNIIMKVKLYSHLYWLQAQGIYEVKKEKEKHLITKLNLMNFK